MLTCLFENTNAQWTSQASGFSTPNRGCEIVTAINKKVSWAEAYEGGCPFCSPITEFTRTTDGGENWVAGSITEYPDDYLLGLFPVTKDVAYAITVDYSLSNERILKTKDGGTTWTLQNTSAWLYNVIYFFNKQDGIVCGGTNGKMKILITQNGGKNWVKVPKANLPEFNSTEELYVFSGTGIGDTFWAATTDARILKSIDKGKHWNIYETPATGEGAFEDVNNLRMRDGLHGLLGFHDQLFRTSDGGETWSELNPQGSWFTNGLSYVPGTDATWVSTGGDVTSSYGALNGIGSSYSIDDGETWILIDTGIDHLGVDFTDETTGYCGGFNTDNENGGMFKYNGAPLRHAAQEENSSVLNLNFYPNPVSQSAIISFQSGVTQNISLQIFDTQGRLIRTLAYEVMSEGTHSLTWNARDESGNAVSGGIYFLRMETESEVKTIQLSVIK